MTRKVKFNRRMLSAFLALLLAAACAVGGAFAAPNDALDGECSRVYRDLAPGANYVGYIFGSSFECGVQELSAVTFDPTDDLRLDAVVTSGASLSQAVADHVRTEKRRVVAALGASGELGGYTVADGEIVFAAEGASPAFGATADGAALIGEISFTAQIKNRRTGEIATANALNSSAEGAAIFTDREDTTLPPDAALIAVDVPYDYEFSPGVPIEGTVSAISLPGGSRLNASGYRIVVALPSVTEPTGFEIGDRVTLTADLYDALGNTALWRTAVFAIPGKTTIVCGGSATLSSSNERTASSVIGVRPDGSLTMLASYKGNSAYSLGFTENELAKLCLKLGMTDAILLAAGDSVEMLAADDSGALRATGRPSAKQFAPIASALMLSVPDESASLMIGEFEDHPAEILSAKNAGYSLRLLEDGGEALRLDCAAAIRTEGASSADAAPADQPRDETNDADDLYVAINSLYKQLEFDSTGEWLTLVIKRSDLEAWYGKIFRGFTA